MEHDEFEGALTQIPGVHQARVVGDGAPAEIHVVATKDRTPKQVVRDIQTLAKASFGMTIDHRIVSIVQLDQPPVTQTRRRRVAINNVVVSSGKEGGRVQVELAWPNGDKTSGAMLAGESRAERCHATAEALLQALRPVVGKDGAEVELQEVVLYPPEVPESVLARVRWSDKTETSDLIGAGVIRDDAVNATARAVMAAVNRKVSQVA